MVRRSHERPSALSSPSRHPRLAEELQLALHLDTPTAERATTWQRAIPRIFEGLRVIAGEHFAPATLSVAHCGMGRLAEIAGGAHRVERRAVQRDASSEVLNLVLQVGGESAYRQIGRDGRLAAGDAVLLDGSHSFDLELGDSYAQIVLQLPRSLLGRRHEALFARIAERLEKEAPATQLVFDMVRGLAGTLALLTPFQRASAFEGVIGLLGVLQREPGGSLEGQRYLRGLAQIDARLSDPDLDAAMLASTEGISRRRLESAFAAHGTSIQRVIWEHRLDRAAVALRDPTQSQRRCFDIALEFGFSSEAHFSRSFRRRFGLAPRAYRRNVVDAQA